MSRFCSNCGTQISEEEKFCPTCGNGISTTPAAAPITPAKPKKNLVIAAVSVVSLLLIIILVASLAGGGYKTPIDNMKNGLQRGSWKTYTKAFPKEIVDTMEKSFSWLDVKDGDELMKKAVDEYKDTYGKNFKISYKVLNKKELSKDDLNDLKSSLEIYGIDKNKVKKAYEVEIEMSITGSKENDSNEVTCTVGQIGTKWYILDGGLGGF